MKRNRKGIKRESKKKTVHNTYINIYIEIGVTATQYTEKEEQNQNPTNNNLDGKKIESVYTE